MAQVKTSTSDRIRPECKGPSSLNGLSQYSLLGAEGVDDRTLHYWKGLSLPPFLFQVVEKQPPSGDYLDRYYKRYVPLLDGHASADDQDKSCQFYQVNKGAEFLAFADPEAGTGGLARDLIIDFVRLAYSKGQIIDLSPAQLGFWPFPDKDRPDIGRVFGEILEWNRDKVQATTELTAALLAKLPPKTSG